MPSIAKPGTDHVWTIGELVEAALAAPVPPPLASPARPQGMSAGKAKGEKGGAKPRFYVLKGGRAK